AQRMYDTPDELAYAVLALRTPEGSAKVLRHHHAGRQLRPRLGDLDIVLLEDHFTLLAGDHGAAAIPLHRIEGIDIGRRPVPSHGRPGAPRCRHGRWECYRRHLPLVLPPPRRLGHWPFPLHFVGAATHIHNM